MRGKVHSSVGCNVAARNHTETGLPDRAAALDVRCENKCNEMFGPVPFPSCSRAERREGRGPHRPPSRCGIRTDPRGIRMSPPWRTIGR